LVSETSRVNVVGETPLSITLVGAAPDAIWTKTSTELPAVGLVPHTTGRVDPLPTWARVLCWPRVTVIG